MPTAKIYALVDPRDNEVRYVGRTLQPVTMRLAEHISYSKRHPDGCPRVRWIVGLVADGLRPECITLEEVPQSEMCEAEKRWVARYEAEGKRLLNSKAAGGGATTSHVIEWTPELIARLGKEADAIIAEDLGVTRKAIVYKRIMLGIPASYDLSRMKPPPPMGGHNRLELPAHIVEQLGKQPDYKLADELGVCKSVIARRRRQSGIPSYAEQTGNSGQFKNGGAARFGWRKIDGEWVKL